MSFLSIFIIMNCSKYDRIIEQPSLGDQQRKQALISLIKEGCLSSLFQHAMQSSRIQWIRNFALMALVKFASLKQGERTITLNNLTIHIDDSLSITKLRQLAARYLFVFVVDNTRLTKLRQIALMGLILGNHKEYCEELMKDSEPWIQNILNKKFNARN